LLREVKVVTQGMKEGFRNFLWKLREKKGLLISLGVFVLILIIGGAVWVGANVFSGKFNGGSSNTNSDGLLLNENLNASGAQNLVPRRLDGVLVPEDQANPYPVAIMIENLTAARPQSGLDKAQVVFEALAEGGITRFLAVFAREDSHTAPEIGPVRSARPYYVDWAEEFDALYVHIGGSPQALRDIPARGIFDLNQFFNSKYFWRDRTRKVASEHTVFTSLEKMVFALRDKKRLDATPTYGTWKFKSDKPLADRPESVKPIVIDFSSFNYKVEYRYDKEKNDYVRYQAEKPHVMKAGDTIRAKNVLVAYTKTSLADSQRLAMETVGSGKALIFLDGTAVDGTWKKESTKDRLKFYDKDGNEVELNSGTTWVEIVPTDRVVKFE